MLELLQTEEFVDLQSAVRDLAARHITAAPIAPDRSATPPSNALAALDSMGFLMPRATSEGGQGIPSHLHLVGNRRGTRQSQTRAPGTASRRRCQRLRRDRRRAVRQRRTAATTCSDDHHPRSPRNAALFRGLRPVPCPGWRRLSSLSGSVSFCPAARRRRCAWPTAPSVSLSPRTAASRLPVLLSARAMAALKVVRDDASSGKIGVRSAATSVVDLVDAEGEVLTQSSAMELSRLIAGFRLAVASILLGVGEAAVRYAADYASSREAFGQPIANFQGVSFPLADAEIALDGAPIGCSGSGRRCRPLRGCGPACRPNLGGDRRGHPGGHPFNRDGREHPWRPWLSRRSSGRAVVSRRRGARGC